MYTFKTINNQVKIIFEGFKRFYIMPYSEHEQQLEYYRLWYADNRDEHIEKMTKYYYKNRENILKQHRIK